MPGSVVKRILEEDGGKLAISMLWADETNSHFVDQGSGGLKIDNVHVAFGHSRPDRDLAWVTLKSLREEIADPDLINRTLAERYWRDIEQVEKLEKIAETTATAEDVDQYTALLHSLKCLYWIFSDLTKQVPKESFDTINLNSGNFRKFYHDHVVQFFV